ncbi:polysaccharide deacetylase family protein [Bradyrhizobium sp.]|uniref:polysaccharide deacetylase family protein n=1 Tax=Bradyrhizobium sp. TaxID=376 RepID=UPI0039E21571
MLQHHFSLRKAIRSSLFAKSLRLRNRRPLASFTFDDFPHSAAINGANILEERDARGTFYLAGSYCEKIVDGVEQYSIADVTRLAGVGHEIGCHTFHHCRASKMSPSTVIEEVRLNAAFVAEHLPKVAMRTFAYPFGDVSFRATQQLQKMFDTCRGIELGVNQQTADLGRLRAVRLYSPTTNVESIRDIVRKAAEPGSWLIFYTHDVEDSPSKFGCQPSLLEASVRAVLAAGFEILPISDALDRLNFRPQK